MALTPDETDSLAYKDNQPQIDELELKIDGELVKGRQQQLKEIRVEVTKYNSSVINSIRELYNKAGWHVRSDHGGPPILGKDEKWLCFEREEDARRRISGG